MAHSYTSLYCHIVYATKNREPVLAESMRSRLLEYSGGMLRADRCSLIAGSALADHVHLLMHAHPPISLS
ncbi:MAG: transposase, partial [Phycisphaerales bacterium JB039]